jgi:2,4-dienoyl-CoA reductase-like NADH-dependent reductase (Old Yellow Enzyme family)
VLNTAIQVGAFTLKNRLVMPPMATGKSSAGHVTDELTAYYRDRAQYSAPGLIILEHAYIAPAGRASSGQLSIAGDDCVDGLAKLVQAIHEAGSAVFAQLNHAGSGAEPETPGVNLSASAVLSPRKTETCMPREMTRAEILMTEADFVRAALRAVRAGCDGVEIHSAHGYLLNQFYSPLTNRRTDAYGPQTMENRLRFHLETVDAVRKAVGQDMPIALRLGGADYLPGGSTEEDAVEACRMLEAAGVNLIDLSGGMCGYVRPEHAEPGYFSSMSEKIKAAVDVPVLLTGGVNTIADAKQLLAEGKADLIGVGRALYRDAHWLEHA